MRKLLAAILTLACLADASAAPPAHFAARVESLRKQVGVPGMSIAIVEDGKVTFAQGFGVRKLGAPEKVDADTIFPNGSTGKAFTVTDLAILVEQGKLDWDDKVIDHLPGFQMWDPWVTREMTIRDLLVHRSGLGLGEGDLLFVPRTNLSRAESVKRIRYLKPATSFRSGYAYDNVLYMVAGQMIEAMTGDTWEKFTHDHVLAPAGMRNSTSDEDARFATANRAWPHARMDGGLRGVGNQEVLDERDELGRNGAPAGGLAVSANDMARWLRIWLAGGKLPDSDQQLFSTADRDEMWTPRTIIPTGPRPAPIAATAPNFELYALGWDIRDYRGAKLVGHGGAVFGFQTEVMLIPEKNVGFYITTNSEDGEIIVGLTFELLDHYLKAPYNDWPAKFIAFKKAKIEAGLKALHAQQEKPANVGPSLPLERYAGTYTDPWYGNIEVGKKDGKLTIDFKSTPRMEGTLEHFQYDSFRTQFTDKTIEPAYVTFNIDADGKVERVTMKAVSPIADFSWDYHDLLFKPAAPSEAKK